MAESDKAGETMEEMVEFLIGVKIDPKEPKTVVVTIGKDKWGIKFDTEKDAKIADVICTKMLEVTVCVFAECKGVLKEGPKVWKPGEPEPEESRYCGDCALFGCDCDAGDVDGNEDQMACEKFVKRIPNAKKTEMDKYEEFVRKQNIAAYWRSRCRKAEETERKWRNLVARSLEFVQELVAERKEEYGCWKGRESAGHARSLKADIDNGDAILEDAKGLLGEDLGKVVRGTAGTEGGAK